MVQTRRDFLKTAGVGASSLALSSLFTRCKEKNNPQKNIKSNIILIVADDLGYGELGCYGQQFIRTPNIDKIASQGKKFTQFYSGSPVCAPSRCVLLTGKHTGHAFHRDNGRPKDRAHKPEEGIFAGQHPLPETEITIAELLKSQGYSTAAIGKWGLGQFGTQGDPNRQGFDLFYGYNCQVHAHNHYPRFLLRNGQKEILKGNDRSLNGEQYSQDLFLLEAEKFIRENRSRSFFLYLPFIIPHLSIQVPEETLNEYKDKIPETPYEHRGYLKHPFPRAAYAAMITHMDQGIGRILELLKELKLDEDTIVIFTSDNGPTYDRVGGSDSIFFESAGPFRGLKGSLYEGGIRVPLVIRWPGKIHPGSVSSHVAAFWDIMATVCDITGIIPPENSDGISFVPELLGSENQLVHDFLYWEFSAYGGQQAVRMGDWKALRFGLKQEGADTSIQLYDLKTDPFEKNNIAIQFPEIINQIHHIMRTSRIESELFPFPEIYA